MFMEKKLAKVIESEKGIEKEVKIVLEDNGNREFETIKDLLYQIHKDLEFAESKGYKDKLLNSPVTLQLVDIYGQVVEGRMTLAVGEVIGDEFILTGNVENVAFVKENINKLEEV